MDFELGCEECGTENEQLFDTVLDNKSLRLCERCARSSGALILLEEKRKNIEKYDERFKKKNQEERQKPAYTFKDLQERYKKVKEEQIKRDVTIKKDILEEKKFIEDLEKEKVEENKEIINNINTEIIPEEKIEQEEEFNKEVSKKIKIRNLFKDAFNLLKKQKPKEENEN